MYLHNMEEISLDNPLSNKKQKIFSEKQKGFRDGLSYSTPQKSKETRGNAITQPRSHPMKGSHASTMAQLRKIRTSTGW